MLKYNKERANRSGSSPRDLQRRNSQQGEYVDATAVIDLIKQVSNLTIELDTIKRNGVHSPSAIVVSTDKMYTEEEFNTELIKALENELVKQEARITSNIARSIALKNTEIQVLSSKVASLEALLKSKDDLISLLKNTNTTSTTNTTKTPVVDNYDIRPEMESSVIDPTEVNKNVESFISIKEDITNTNKEVMQDKLSKLKSILGGD